MCLSLTLVKADAQNGISVPASVLNAMCNPNDAAVFSALFNHAFLQ
jgi:hypothetical protein